jgi:hypothetical protein
MSPARLERVDWADQLLNWILNIDDQSGPDPHWHGAPCGDVPTRQGI